MKHTVQPTKALRALVALGLCILPFGIHAYTPYVTPDTAFNPLSQPIGYVAQDELTDFNLTSGVETLFRPEYNQQYWSGNLHAYPISSAGGINLSSERWTGGAAQQITAQNPTTGRFIATMDGAGVGRAFTSANASIMNTVASSNVSVNGATYTPAQIIAYLRGDQSQEAGGTAGGQLRARNTVLGDILHSRPYYVDDDTYPTVFVGANDGMLHAIDANSGQERWAYIPSLLLPNLQKLAYSPLDASNPFKHNLYVDGQINVGAVNNGAIQLLVGGLGAGGQGLYALNITDLSGGTETNVAAKARWEISSSLVKLAGSNTSTASNYTHLGYTYGQPLLTQVQVNSTNATTTTDVVIVGNGLNPSETGGNAYLYVINALTGAQIAEIRAPGSATGASGITSGVNGIFNPVGVSTDNSGVVDRIYAGDLNGTLWRFDLSGNVTPANWTATAVYSTSPAQPITATPGVALHPNGGYMVTFGTGSTLFGSYGTYNHTSASWTTSPTGELGNTATHYVYGIWDGAPATNTTLLTQTLNERVFVNGSVTTRVRRGSANIPNWSSGGNKGWKVALPIAGERTVGEGSFIESGRFYFNAYNPTVVPTLISGTSTDIYGENWLMELNYLTGGSAPAPFMDMDGSLIIDTNDRIKYTSSDTLPSGASVGDPITSPNQDGIPIGKMLAIGVQSQPLLVQLSTLNTTLLNQNPDVIYPATTTVSRGVAGGHFDVDFFNNTANNTSNNANNGNSSLCGNLSGSTATTATASVTFNVSTGGKGNSRYTVSSLSITANNEVLTLPTLSSTYSNSALAQALVGSYSAHYAVTSASSGTITISASATGAAWNGNVAVNLTVSGVNNPSYSFTRLTGGTDGTPLATTSSSTCGYTVHTHEYDKLYDKTGINMLNPSVSSYQLANAIPNPNTPFKVLVMNQYLNPAIQINLADKTSTQYNPSAWTGYTPLANFQSTGSTPVDPTALPTYTMGTLGSLAINMPVDAFSVENWWGSTSQPDPRVGVMPTSPACVYNALVGSGGNPTGSVNATLYNPVIPPTTVTTTGNGTVGSNTGVRHNGAITIQIIAANTPASAIEFNDPAGNPAYGSRVKAASYFNYVIAEYALYWHHPSRVCYGDPSTTWYNGSRYGNGYPSASSGAWNTSALMTGTGWTKLANPDTIVTAATQTPAPGSTDPKIGSFGNSGTGNATSISTTVSGNITTTTIRYADGSMTVIITTTSSDGSATVQTTSTTASGISTTNTSTVANAAGSVKSGGDETGSISSTRRIAWRELIRP